MLGVVGLLAWCVGLAQSWDVAISKGDLLEFYTNNAKTVTVRFEGQKLAALAYDQVHNVMLYVDKQNDNDAICSFNMTSLQHKCLIERNGRNIRGLALDPATDLLFFTDTKERSIDWISLKPESKNGVHGNVLIKLHDEIPTDIAVDSCRGYIYWINTNLATPTIERARFDGTERKVIINLIPKPVNTTYRLEPHSLVIDQHTQKLLFVEYLNINAYNVYFTDLEGNNKGGGFYHFFGTGRFSQPLNKLAVSKDSFYVGYSDVVVWNVSKSTGPILKFNDGNNLDNEIPVGIASYYDIVDQIPDSQACEALKKLVRNSPKAEENCCVHGTKLDGQSLCKCTTGYIGERCDVSVCENYCIQGNCSSNDEGVPQCSCFLGYSGTRCEINMCHGFCLNNGECSLNEEDEPACQCADGYEGSRCEVSTNQEFK
ncbi:hypothetical protein PYW07_003050 [Mythimna separata]|uniref:Protein cueball n=1 Tax=Mythimna separata TaxID=271217 RepID=A0AAD8DQ92_MYTSE|nr:hypothetical protein PYW07_003050 [Mythimna separata]